MVAVVVAVSLEAAALFYKAIICVILIGIVPDFSLHVCDTSRIFYVILRLPFAQQT